MSKAEGNALLKGGKLEAAAECYTRALCASPSPDADERAAILANRALANLKLGSHAACADDCSAALDVSPRYVKALYRRAQAREAQDNLADAFRDLRELLRIDPDNAEAKAFAARIKRALEARAATGDLSTPTHAVATLNAATDPRDRVGAVGKLSRIAEDESRAAELLHAGAVPPLLALLPDAGELERASELDMPIVGLAVEALERMSRAPDPAVRRAIADPPRASGTADAADGVSEGRSARKLLGLAAVAAGARHTLDDAASGGSQLKNLEITAARCLALLAHLASDASAVGSQSAQNAIIVGILPMLKHEVDGVSRAALDCMLHVSDKDARACDAILPQVVRSAPAVPLLPLMMMMGRRRRVVMMKTTAGAQGSNLPFGRRGLGRAPRRARRLRQTLRQAIGGS